MSTTSWTRARATRGRLRNQSRELSPDIADMKMMIGKPNTKRKSNKDDSANAYLTRSNKKGKEGSDSMLASFVQVSTIAPEFSLLGKRNKVEKDSTMTYSPNKKSKHLHTNPYEEPAGSLSSGSSSSRSNSPLIPFNLDDAFESLVPNGENEQTIYDSNLGDKDLSVQLHTPCPSPLHTPETVSPLMSPLTPSTPQTSPLTPITSEEPTGSSKNRVLQHIELKDYERPGKLESLKLWNFMSHSNFEKEWHPNVNYIIGDNGSGKSAILTGILLGLGAKSSATGRATSAAGFIKHDCQSCKIEVVLTNDGSLDLDRYGNKIVIRRHIDSRGVSKYQIKTAENKMRPLERKELDRINATLQIMPDNPLQFLNQETSKNFLRTGDPKKMYNYFYHALLLFECEDLLKISNSDMENAKTTLKGKRKGWEEKQTRASELKKEYEVIVSLQSASGKILHLERECFWASVISLENRKKQIEVKYNSAEERAQTVKKEIKEVRDKRESLKSGLESEAIELKRLNQALRNKEAEKDQKCREIKDAHVDLTESRVKLKGCEKTIAENAKAVNILRDKVARLQKEVETNYERRKLEVDTKRAQLEEKERRINEKVQVLTEKDQAYMQDLENYESIEKSERFENIDIIKRRRNEKQRELTNVMKAKSTPYDRFGVHMERLINKMNENRHRFKYFPKGPQGMLYTVKPKYEKYTALVEFILYSSLYQFKVSTQEDFNLMNQLIKEVYGAKEIPQVRRATLFLAPEYNGRYNLSLSATTKEYPTVLDVLDIVNDDPAVTNWLADGRGAERILLFPDFRVACDLMKSAQDVPKGCTQGFTLDSRLLTPAPDYRCYVKNVNSKPRIVQTTKFDKTAGIQEDIRQMDKEIENLQKELKQAKANTEAARKRSNQVRLELRQLKKELVNVKTELGQLDTSNNYVPDVASHLEEIQERQEEINQKEKEKEVLKERVKEFEAVLKIATTNVNELDDEIYKLQTEASQIEDKTGSVESQKNELNVKIKKLEVILGKLIGSRDALKKEMDEINVGLKKKLKDKHSKSQRIETKREATEIKQEIDGLKTVLEKNKGRIKNKDGIYREWKKAQSKADTVGEEIRICEHLIQALAPTLKLQQDHFKRKKNEYGNTLQACFHSLITARQYGGSLVIDHNDRTLVYFVSRDNSSEARAMRNFDKTNQGDFKMVNKRGIKDFTSALSGGERSFATICFMISLWQTMEAPFFVLDEFDVFMDPFNRRASQNIISCHTRNQREAQFFFITPLSLDFMHSSEYTSVLRLYPPVRDIEEQDKQAESPEDSSKQTESEPPPRKRQRRT